MKAAQYIARGTVGFLEVPDPTPTAGQVIVKLDKVAVCGSDVKQLYYDDIFPLSPGVSGHECVGFVVESGSPEFKVGDRVLAIPPAFDGWAQYLSLDPRWLIPVPDSLGMEQGVLAQLLGCVIWALKKVDNMYDKDVVVIGQGPAGIFFSNLIANMGAKRVIGLDLEDHRLAIARRMGATHTINANASDINEQISAITEGQMADMVVEVVGTAETVDQSIHLGKTWADLLIFGIPKVSPIPFDMMESLRKQQRLITTVGTQFEPNLRSFRLAMAMIEDGRIDVRPLISHCLPFGQLGQAMELAYRRTEAAVKVLVEVNA